MSQALRDTLEGLRTRFRPGTVDKRTSYYLSLGDGPDEKWPVPVTDTTCDLAPGKKVMGTTIAELGNRNRPLDMIVYNKGGHDFILLNNSSRGVMKLPTEKLESYDGITKPISDKAGVPYETLSELKGVEHLDKIDNTYAMLLIRGEGGALDLKRMTLP